MGSYVATLTLFSVTGGLSENWTANGDTKVKEGNSIFPVNSASGQIVYTFTGNFMSLDGNPSIAFEGFPAGMEIQNISWATAETGTFTTAIGWMTRGSSSDVISDTVTWGTRTTNNNCSAINPSSQNILAPSPVSNIKIIEILNSLQHAGSLTANVGFTNLFVYKNLKATGNYDIYNSVTNDGSNVFNGKITHLTAPGLLDQLSTIQIYNSAGLVATPSFSATPTSLTFTWPSISSGNYLLLGTEVGGRQYVLGPFVYILADPSGLYQIVPGKTNDTLYKDHSTTTMDVAIPNPFIKTGFING